MKTYIFSLLLLIILSFIGFSCSSTKKSNAEESITADALNQDTVVPDTFVLPYVPENLTSSEARADYLVIHYWNRFDFSDEKLISRPEITEQAFVDYINILAYVSKTKADESLVNTLKKAEQNVAMYTHFIGLFDKYFYQPNSPFRNEEFFIPVLAEVLKSKKLPETEQSNYQFKYDLMMKNRVGTVADNFQFTLDSGQTKSLYSINSDYLILMFANPDCHTCAAVTTQLDGMESLKKAFSMNSPTRTMITVLTVYPDGNTDQWKKHLPQMPQHWINAYDKGMTITHKRIYDIKAIPTLYLLDKNKKVILKDTSIEEIDRFFQHV